MASYQGVDVDHPDIVRNIIIMAKNGKSKEEIAVLVGMPWEVVDRHINHAKREGKLKD